MGLGVSPELCAVHKEGAKASSASKRLARIRISLSVLEWPSQIPDLSQTKNLWHDLKIAVYQQNSFSLKELELFNLEEWAKFLGLDVTSL